MNREYRIEILLNSDRLEVEKGRMWKEDDCLLQSDNYDFENQLTYMYSRPIEVTAGEELLFSCTWNNSTSNPNLIHNPPVDVGYGERTDEEMCFGFSLISF